MQCAVYCACILHGLQIADRTQGLGWTLPCHVRKQPTFSSNVKKYDIRRGMSPPPAPDTIQELQTCVACFRQNSLLTKVNENGPQWTFWLGASAVEKYVFVWGIIWRPQNLLATFPIPVKRETRNFYYAGVKHFWTLRHHWLLLKISLFFSMLAVHTCM